MAASSTCRKTLRMKTYPKTPESYHINGRGDHVTYPISPQASRSLNCLSANHQFPASPDHVSHKNVYLTLGYSIAPGMSDGQLLVMVCKAMCFHLV